MYSSPSFLEFLRSKPHAAKQRIAFSVALTLTSLIFLFWLSSFFVHVGNSVGNPGNGMSNTADTVAVTTSSSPLGLLGSFGASVADLWKQAREKWQNVGAIAPSDKLQFIQQSQTEDLNTVTSATDTSSVENTY